METGRIFLIDGMHCASCTQKIEDRLLKLRGVKKACVNLATRRATVLGDADRVKIFRAIRELGYEPRELNDEVSNAVDLVFRFQVALVFTIPIVLIAMSMFRSGWSDWLQLMLTLPVVWAGRDFFLTALRLGKRFSANMDTLVALGTGAAIAFSLYSLFWGRSELYFESAAVIITLIILGRLLEDRAKGRAAEAIRKLMSLAPSKARVLQNGQEVEIDTQAIAVGDIVVLRPGESVPVDGIVTDGASSVNESALTGESTSIAKQVGDSVWAATINLDGRIAMRAHKIGADTVLQKIIRLVESAQSSKAPIQRLADVVSRKFVPVVLVIAGLTLVFWLSAGHGWEKSVLSAVAVLVIACPCALGLATPTAVLVGTGRAAEIGVVIRNAESLELAQNINVLVFDKTGTLTLGKPEVSDAWFKPGKDSDHLKSIIASVEMASEHPLARAIVEYCGSARRVPISTFRAVAGQGAEADVSGQQVRIGNAQFLGIESLDGPVNDQVERYRAQGKTVSFCAIDGEVSALFALSDAIRPQALVALNHIRRLGIHTVMASGDNRTTALEVAQELGIDEVVAPCLPGDKANLVKKLQDDGKIVGMVGDGINDAPALAQADVSFALGTGTDIALETASVALLKGDISRVALAIELSARTVTIIRQNLFWAFVYNIVAIPFAAFGWLNPMVAAAAMALSSISVVTNSLRLRRFR